MEELVTQLVQFLTGLGGGWAVAVAFICALCAAVAIVLPAPKADASVLWRFVYRLINMLAGNVGKAKNFDDTLRRIEKEDLLEREKNAPEKIG